MNRFLLFVIGVLGVVCFGLYAMLKMNEQALDSSQQGLQCAAYVHDGVDLTGKGENNCTQ